MEEKTQVFLSYASEDLALVRKLYSDLKKRSANVWFDKEKLKPGPWRPQIMKAITRSRYFVICLSDSALKKIGDEPGFQDEELNYAYDISQNQSVLGFSIVPIRLEQCHRGDHRLSTFQQYDFFDEWEVAVDRLAVDLGGKSLLSQTASDKQSPEEQFIKSLRGKAEAFNYAGDYRNALVAWESIRLLFGDTVHTWRWRSMLLLNLDRKKEALTVVSEGLSIHKKDAWMLNFKGVVLRKLGRFKKALAANEQSLEIANDDPETWSNRGTILRYLGRDEEALVAHERALSLDPNNGFSMFCKALTVHYISGPHEAVLLYEQAFKMSAESEINALWWYNYACALNDSGQMEKALRAYEKALELNDSYAEAWNNKGTLLKKLGRIDEALACFQKALEINPELDQAIRNEMSIEFIRGRGSNGDL